MREPWTSEETARAVAMKRAGISAVEIGKRLGRTAKAVNALCHRKGASRRLDHHGGQNRRETYSVSPSLR